MRGNFTAKLCSISINVFSLYLPLPINNTRYSLVAQDNTCKSYSFLYTQPLICSTELGTYPMFQASELAIPNSLVFDVKIEATYKQCCSYLEIINESLKKIV